MNRLGIVSAAAAVLVLLAAASAACSASPEATVESSVPATTASLPDTTGDATASTAATTTTTEQMPATTLTTPPTEPAAPPQADNLDGIVAEIEGRWEGVTSIPGLGELPFSIELTAADGTLNGSMDIQGNVGLPLTALSFDGSVLHFELQSPLGLATWEGELRNGVIEGEFDQLGNTGTFLLHRPGAEPDSIAESEADPGYRSEDVTIDSGGFVLAGEIALPDGDGPHPAVVLINGSGDQDRDVTVGEFRLFADLAGHLAHLGIASVRWDDRGVGGSDGNGLLTTLKVRAGDVEAAVELLRSRADIDANRIGLVGHSEGGLIAPIVASRSDSVAFVALLASSAVPGDELLRMQLPRVLQVAGSPPDEIARLQAHQELILQAILTDEGWDEVELSFQRLTRRELEDMADDDRESIPDEERFADIAVQQQMALVRSPSYRSFVEYDPRPDIVELQVPLLALFGELDAQVPPAANAAALSEAIADSAIPNYAIGTVLGANHLFQSAVTGSPDEYTELEPAFAPDFLQLLSDWLTEQVNR